MVRVTASAIRLSVGLISGYSPELVLASVLTERDYVSPTDAINIKMQCTSDIAADAL